MSSKTVKYIWFVVKPVNAVNDIVKCSIWGNSTARLESTGPFEQYEGDWYLSGLVGATWDNVWYNGSVKSVLIEKIEIEYMDGTTATIPQSDISSLFY